MRLSYWSAPTHRQLVRALVKSEMRKRGWRRVRGNDLPTDHQAVLVARESVGRDGYTDELLQCFGHFDSVAREVCVCDLFNILTRVSVDKLHWWMPTTKAPDAHAVLMENTFRETAFRVAHALDPSSESASVAVGAAS